MAVFRDLCVAPFQKIFVGDDGWDQLTRSGARLKFGVSDDAFGVEEVCMPPHSLAPGKAQVPVPTPSGLGLIWQELVRSRTRVCRTSRGCDEANTDWCELLVRRPHTVQCHQGVKHVRKLFV